MRKGIFLRITVAWALPSFLGSAKCICSALLMLLSSQNNVEIVLRITAALNKVINESFSNIAPMMSRQK